MKTKQILLLLFLLSFSTILCAQEIGFPIIRNYSPNEYNNTPQVPSILQDNRGIMYFGLASELMEYDGVFWRPISIDKNTPVYNLAKDDKGKIYVACHSDFGYLKTDIKGNTIYQSLTHLINDSTLQLGTVWSVKLTTKHVYFQTFNAILQYTPSAENLQIFKADTNGKFTGDFVYQDTYYVRLNKKGLMKVENNILKPTLQLGFFKNKNDFISAIPYNDTTLFVPTRTEGLYLYHLNSDSVPERISLSKNDFLFENSITASVAVKNDFIALGSMKKGAILMDKQANILQQYNENNQLQNDLVRSIATDASSNIWLGLSNGISRIALSQDLTYWNRKTGLKDNAESVIKFNNNIYIATHQKVYYINSNNELKEVQNIQPGMNWSFLELKQLSKLLIGTQNGIYEINGDKASLIVKGVHAYELYQSKKQPNRIYSTLDEAMISLKFINNKWVIEGKWNGLNDNIRGFIEDENDDIWLGTYRNGAIRITPDYENITKPKKIRYYSEKDGISSMKNILPFKFKNRIIWGSEKGLSKYNSKTDRFEPFCELGEQFCNGSRDVFSLIEMPDGKVWICPLENKKADIGYLQPNNTGGYDWIYKPFRRIPNMFLITFYIESSGIAWIGGSEGVYRYDMTKDTKIYTQSFNCLIRKVTANVDSLLYGGNTPDTTLSGFQTSTKLKYEFNSVKFEFAAPFFDQEEKTSYSYKLEGYDKEWSKYSRESKKEYTNLNEGTYIFNAKARNVYDVESDIATYQVTILPPWHRSIWAYIGYVVLLSLFIWLIVWLNSKRLKAANLELEETVVERTAEIQAQAKELEKLSIVASETDNAVIIMDYLFNFEWVNDGFIKLYGVSFDGLGLSIGSNLIESSRYEKIKDVTNLCQESKESVRYETLWNLENNRSIWVQTTLTPIIDEMGRIKKYVAIDSDISEIKQAEIAIKHQNEKIQAHEQELEAFNEELTATNEEIYAQKEQLQYQNEKLVEIDEFKQGMTSMIVHDLKNPLNSIINVSKAITPEKQVGIMQQWGKQMLNMVLNILDVHKYEEVKMNLALEEKQFALIAQNSIHQVQFLLEQKEITLKNRIDEELVTRVEEEVIERVMVNLLTNAIKYTPAGGTITLSTNQLSAEMVRIEVTDMGEGIAEDKAHLVFQKFGQIVAKNSGGVRSTGLGLSFCKLAVEAHGGEIGFTSETGKGTIFWFTLQRGSKDHLMLQTIEKEEVIELESIVFTQEERKVITPIISRLKAFTVYETDDIEEVLEELKQHEFDNIQKWVLQIKKCIITLNQLGYFDLIKKI